MLFRHALSRHRRGRHLRSRASQRHHLSSLPLSPHIIVTDSFDPFLNLAFEDALLERRRVENAVGMQLLIWRNEKAVILGRNQNPWVECNIPYLRRHNIPIVRRSSGGGTVYHDLGNSNITIFAQDHLPERNLNFVISALSKSFGLPAYISPRKDIFLDQKKVSGSAYRITGKQCYHHMTLLRETDLSMLEESLLPTVTNVQTKATESVRSKVLNVSEKCPEMTHATLVSALAAQFRAQFHADAPTLELGPADLLSFGGVQSRMAELSSWDNIFGTTPEFSHTTSTQFTWGHVELTIRCLKGNITSCDIRGPPDAVDALVVLKSAFEGSRYRASAIIERIEAQMLVTPLGSTKDQEMMNDLVTWVAHTIVH